MLSSAKTRWSTSHLEDLIQQATSELSATLHELHQLGAPSLTQSVITLNQLHEQIDGLRISVMSECSQCSEKIAEAPQSLEDLFKMARTVEACKQKLRDRDELEEIMQSLQFLSSYDEDDSDMIDWLKQSSFSVLQNMSSPAADTIDEFPENASPFSALHRLITAEDLTDDDWEHLSNIIALKFPKRLSVAVRRGRIYIDENAITAEFETDSAPMQSVTIPQDIGDAGEDQQVKNETEVDERYSSPTDSVLSVTAGEGAVNLVLTIQNPLAIPSVSGFTRRLTDNALVLHSPETVTESISQRGVQPDISIGWDESLVPRNKGLDEQGLVDENLANETLIDSVRNLGITDLQCREGFLSSAPSISNADQGSHPESHEVDHAGDTNAGEAKDCPTEMVNRKYSDSGWSMMWRSEAEMAFWVDQSLEDMAAATKRLMSLLDERKENK